MEKVIKPWGYYEVLLDEPNYKVKRLYLKPNSSFSYQYHKHRKEFWVVTEGDGIVITDGSEYNAKPESMFIIMEQQTALLQMFNRKAEVVITHKLFYKVIVLLL